MMDWLQSNGWLTLVGGVALLGVVAWVTNLIARRFFLSLVRRVAERTETTWDDRIIQRKVFHRVANVAPALVTYYGIALALGIPAEDLAAFGAGELTTSGSYATAVMAAVLIRRVSLAFIVVVLTMAASAFLAAVNDIYTETYEEAANRPIKGYLQVVTIFLYIAAGIVAVAILADRSPVFFLSGLGALTAVLMLVFRDTILSLVASVQIMSNDMIRIGDWVEMPQAHADGDVIDIALHTVKIQNWDKTISAVPTHKFISESFKNWRGMSESGGRRIKRSLNLDVTSVHFLTDEEVAHLSRYEFLKGYMAQKREELAEHNRRTPQDPDVIPHRRRLTNVGTFRAYVQHYLENHPKIHQDMTLLVRQLESTPKGLPIQIYCFTNDTAWAHYEGIQADIFDHLLAILPEFGLKAFQEPAGSDFGRWAGGTSGEGDALGSPEAAGVEAEEEPGLDD